MDNNDNTLGCWSKDNFKKTIQENYGLGINSDLPPQIRFWSSVANLINKRKSRPESVKDNQQPAVFLLKPNPSNIPNLKKINMLDTAREQINGRLWFVNEPIIVGNFIDIKINVEDIFDYVARLGMGNIIAAIYDPDDDSNLRLYPKGLSFPDDCQVKSININNITINDIYLAIDKIHEENLITPDTHTTIAKLWKNTNKFYAARDAESKIQTVLKCGLTLAFLPSNIRIEQKSKWGRLDLEIEENDFSQAGKTIKHAILELKVLRAFGEKGKKYSKKITNYFISKGVKQAACYRKDKNARLALLCCFDMRKENTGDTCFDHVQDLAKKLSVSMKNWHIFASSEDYRDWKTSKSKAPSS